MIIGRTALQFAAAFVNFAVIKLLAETGKANIEPKVDLLGHRTPLAVVACWQISTN